jgi:hypothetical protein
MTLMTLSFVRMREYVVDDANCSRLRNIKGAPSNDFFLLYIFHLIQLRHIQNNHSLTSTRVIWNTEKSKLTQIFSGSVLRLSLLNLLQTERKHKRYNI